MGSIRLEKVSKHFGEHAVIPSIDLEINEGEFVVFVGPSGCGKSTLLRLIAGLEDVTSGRILIDGEDATDKPPAKRGLAMVFQSYALYPHMSVRNNIGFPLKMANVDKAEIDRKVEDAAKILNLTDYLERKPRALSGGQRQRVAMGRSIVRNPQVFLFDEPLSNLDAKLRVQMRGEIKTLHRRLKTTMVYVTHDQIEAMTMADRIVVMQAGRIEQIGSPLELYDRPANAFVAQFIGSPAMNLFPATVQGGELALAGGASSGIAAPANLPEGHEVLIGKRPEEIRLASEGPLQTSVENIEPTGSETFVELRFGDQPLSVVLRDRPDFDIGASQALQLHHGASHIFDRKTGERLN